MDPNPFILINWIIKYYAFSGPVAVWICYQFLKIEFARIDKKREVTWSSVSRFGAEIIITCIPILLTLWKNPSSKLYKEFAQEPLFLMWSFFLLFLSAAISLVAVRKYETLPDKRIMVNYISGKIKSTRLREFFRICCNIFRKIFYFLWSVGSGLIWFITLYSYR